MGAVKNHFHDEICALPDPREPREDVPERRADGSYTYRNWHIAYDPPPIQVRSCDWGFWHDDYDGAEDSGDNRYGFAPSLEAAKAEIDAIEDDEPVTPSTPSAAPLVSSTADQNPVPAKAGAGEEN